MKVLLFLPFAPDSPTGNAVTARRIRRNLAPLGVDVVLQHLPADARLEDVQAAIAREGPDVLQWYNAWKTGRWLTEVKRGLPNVVTLTGTDINREAEDSEHRRTVLSTLREADAVVTYSSALRDHAVALLPEVAPRVHVIPKGVELGTARYELPAWAAGDVVLFLLPAGVRPEKNNRFAVRALDAVHAADPRVRLLLAGPVIDAAYEEELRADLATRPWAGHVDSVPHEAMASVYAQSAVVLNTSLSEGLANAVLEAMTCGRPVLASDIEGNRQVVVEGETGLLYRDESEFAERARRLASDGALRERLGAAGRTACTERNSSSREASVLGRILKEACLLGDRDAWRFRFQEGLRPGDSSAWLAGAAETLRRHPDQQRDLRQLPRGPRIYSQVGTIQEASSDRVRADHATDLVADGILQDAPLISGKSVWDVGCGSGVLAALCARLGAREVLATDVDEEALALCKQTASLNGVSVRAVRAGLMDCSDGPSPDIVVANLPQKPVPEGMTLAVANDGGPDGTRLLLPFVEQAASRLHRGARLYLFKHTLSWLDPVLERLTHSFRVVHRAFAPRVFHEDEFAALLPYWRERRSMGRCQFEEIGAGRYAFLCEAWTCVRR